MSITLHIHDIVCAVTVQPECVCTMSCVLACACDPCMLVCMQNYSLNRLIPLAGEHLAA